MTKIEQNTVIWPFIFIMWVGPHKFFWTGPPHLLIQPCLVLALRSGR